MAGSKIHHLVVRGKDNVSEMEKHVVEGDRVWWHPDTSDLKVTIDFDFDGTPLEWKKRPLVVLPGKTVKGTVRSGITGGTSFRYNAAGGLRRGGKRAQPELIVDGRRRSAGKTSRKKAAKKR